MIQPRITIIVPVLNGEKYIRQALQSAIDQIFRDFEIIVVDGKSTDKTVKIVNEFAKKDKRINLVTQISPGLPSARNLGVSLSKGEYIAFLEADDVWHPEKLLLQVECLDKNPDIGLVSCYSAVIDQNGLLLGWILGINVNGDVYKKVIWRNSISSCSVPLIRKKCLDEVGQFDDDVKFCDDYDMWVRLAKKYLFKTITKPLVGYRRCESNRSKNYRDMFQEGKKNLDRFFQRDSKLSTKFYRFCLARKATTIAGLCIIDKKYEESFFYLKCSLGASKLAPFIDCRMFNIFLLALIVKIVGYSFFENIILKNLLPLVFKTKPGKKFISD